MHQRIYVYLSVWSTHKVEILIWNPEENYAIIAVKGKQTIGHLPLVSCAPSFLLQLLCNRKRQDLVSPAGFLSMHWTFWCDIIDHSKGSAANSALIYVNLLQAVYRWQFLRERWASTWWTMFHAISLIHISQGGVYLTGWCICSFQRGITVNGRYEPMILLVCFTSCLKNYDRTHYIHRYIHHMHLLPVDLHTQFCTISATYRAVDWRFTTTSGIE